MCCPCDCESFYCVGAWVAFVSLSSWFMAIPLIYYLGLSKGIWWPAVLYGILMVYTFANFAAASCMDPGSLPRADPNEAAMVEAKPHPPVLVHAQHGVEIHEKWCHKCNIYPGPRGCHCSRCGYCIVHRDHHCIWINNCVGIRNYRVFFIFVHSLVFLLVMVVIGCLVIIGLSAPDSVSPVDDWPAGTFVSAIFIAILCMSFVAPLAQLLVYHWRKVVLPGLTTIENIRSSTDLPSLVDVKNKSFKYGGHNLYEVFCRPQYPRFESNSCCY